MKDQMKTASKYLSYLLRHKPESIGLTLDSEGWADIHELIGLTVDTHTPLTLELIEDVVRDNDKQRFMISEDGLRIRACQGHSRPVNLNLVPKIPPEYLFHGTASRFLPSIMSEGLKAGSRQYVHLSKDISTTVNVGSRHGKPVVIAVNALDMQKADYQFYLSANGVWLTPHVPVCYLNPVNSFKGSSDNTSE